ncbi:PREDICTED: circumsporozoite protein-like [Rhinopithecus bieti]|uniref:circumsporozoite protein-like n=1 Tax=Rhinopithecus bieti TaxID=61621 RepID=UPI00083BEDBC|nr:PREDICTED: circumsporozoite protein-like [Rhinopithecus bieti]
MPGAVGGSRAPADSSESPAARPGGRGDVGDRGERPGRRRPRSFEARRAGKPHGDGCAGAGRSAPTRSPAARADGWRLKEGASLPPPAAGGGFRSLPPSTAKQRPAGPSQRARSAPAPCRSRCVIGRRRFLGTSAGLGDTRGRRGLPPPLKTLGLSVGRAFISQPTLCRPSPGEALVAL